MTALFTHEHRQTPLLAAHLTAPGAALSLPTCPALQPLRTVSRPADSIVLPVGEDPEAIRGRPVAAASAVDAAPRVVADESQEDRAEARRQLLCGSKRHYELEEELRASEQALEDADRRKHEFLATLAHELRNPLAPLRNGLELLRRGGLENEELARVQDMMQRQLGHLVRLVDDLLDVSRMSRGQVELKRERVKIQTVLEHAVELGRPLVEARRHVLTTSFPSAPVWVDGDLTRLAQVVGNLLDNAAKYTPPGGHIRVSAAAEGGETVVRVVDDGIGIAAEMLPRVFDLFVQVDRALYHPRGGLGIGLSLVRRLAELHGGTITAQSPGLGRGSTFTLRLPLASGAPAAVGSPAVEPAALPARLRILVVDDNTDAAQTLAMLLELSGHEARTAGSGPVALETARAFVPEVVFLDLGMPGMDGFEVARRLRADPSTAGAVLVALTGWGSEDAKRQSRDAGFDGHLTKPAGPAAIENVLAGVTSACP